MIYSAQIRAARGLLDWNRDQLAQAAGIGLSTVQRMEKGEGLALGQAGNIWRLQAALEAAGIVFLPAGYRGDGAKALQLSNGGACAAPTQTSASRAEYPLSRFVWLEGKAEGATLAFFDYVLSAEGQRDAVIAGHFILPYVFGEEERRKLGLD